MAISREPAHRLFAEEYNASKVHLPGEGDMAPSYVVSPLGAKINRLHVVGVCTAVEPVGESGDLLRARISDPTGVFTVYAGQYQQEAMDALSSLEVPCFVAVTGKARTYEPEPGSMIVSIRPESLHVADEATRNQWILDTARRTNERIAAQSKAAANPDGSADGLIASGVPAVHADGALISVHHYVDVDANRFRNAAKTALEGLLPGGTIQVHEVQARDDDEPVTQTDAPAWTPPTQAAAPEADAAQDALDDEILKIVMKLEGDGGAEWDAILQEAGSDSEEVEEALNRLMDKGLVYEPTLGVLKST
ncbi:MAG: RPA family protein [Thermoplasmatota archaeon]